MKKIKIKFTHVRVIQGKNVTVEATSTAFVHNGQEPLKDVRALEKMYNDFQLIEIVNCK